MQHPMVSRYRPRTTPAYAAASWVTSRIRDMRTIPRTGTWRKGIQFGPLPGREASPRQPGRGAYGSGSGDPAEKRRNKAGRPGLSRTFMVLGLAALGGLLPDLLGAECIPLGDQDERALVRASCRGEPRALVADD